MNVCELMVQNESSINKKNTCFEIFNVLDNFIRQKNNILCRLSLC